MALKIAIEQLFPVAIDRVWQALTDSQMVNRWLMATDDFEAEVGARFTLRGDQLPGSACHVECEVLELSPPHRMVWSWCNTEDHIPTRLVIELEAEGDATRLTLRHTGETDKDTAARTRTGWHEKLDALAAALAAHGH